MGGVHTGRSRPRRLERLEALHKGGTIDDDEYAKLKAQIVG